MSRLTAERSIRAMAIVEVEGLRKLYGERVAVADVGFRVEAGECVGLLGPNGAGKTTVIKMLLGLSPPSAGTVRLFGCVLCAATARTIRSQIGVVQQEDSLDPDLSVERNLAVWATYYGIAVREASRRADAMVRFAALEDRRHARIKTLSGGMRRRLMLARALMNDPSLLVLDEPTTGLDPQARRLVWERIRQLKRAGTTILLTTHYMDEAAQLCDRLVIVDGGRIVAEGAPGALIAEWVGAEVVEVYLPEQDGERLAQRLAAGPWRSEQVGEVVYVYLRDAGMEPALRELIDGAEFAHRCATLEDVFLRLTGHSLRE